MPDRTRSTRPPYSEEQATAWLSWLARGMRKHGQTVFLIEQLQPSWLAGRGQLLVYMLGSRLLGSLVFGLACGVIWLYLKPELLAYALSAAAIGGLSAGLIAFFRLPETAQPGTFKRVVGASSVFALAGLMGVVAARLSVPAEYFDIEISNLPAPTAQAFVDVWRLLLVPLFGLFWGIHAHRRSLTTDVHTAEVLTWSWRRAGKRALTAGTSGFVILTIIYLLRTWKFGPDPDRMLTWCTLVIFLVLLSIVFGGLRADAREMRTAPNQGIRLSIRSSLSAAGAGGPIVGIFLLGALAVVVAVTAWESSRDPSESSKTLALMAVAAGILASQHYGGLAVIQHYLLRFLLYLRGSIPWRYADFLDYAAEELGFLQKVGGGYIFVHRYLLEHFAAMEEAEVSPRPRR